MAVVAFSITKLNEWGSDPEADGVRVTLDADLNPVAWTYVRWVKNGAECRITVAVPASIAWNSSEGKFTAEQLKKSVKMIKVNDDDPVALGDYIRNDTTPNLLTSEKISELANADNVDPIVAVIGAVGELRRGTEERTRYRTFNTQILDMSEKDDSKFDPEEIAAGAPETPAPPAEPTTPPNPQPTAPSEPTTSTPATPASAAVKAEPTRSKVSKPPPPPAPAPPVPPEKALSLPVDGIAMIAGYSKGETAPFALQNVYLKKGEGGFGINNDAVVTLKKRFKLFGQPGDIFTLDCTPSNFILIPVVYKKPINEASHWTSAFVQRPGAKTAKSRFAYVAVKNVEWKFEENWIQYGVPEAPRVLLIDYEEAPEGLAYPDDVDLIPASQANRVCETISPFDAVATGFMNYLVSSNRDRNPTGIPLYRTQNLNVYMNRFPPA